MNPNKNPYGDNVCYYSIYKGEVADRKDPNKAGRIKVILRPIFGDEPHDYWAEPRGMFTGKGTGLIAIPQIGDLVWVSFEEGNPEFPVWEYGPYQDGGTIESLYDEDGEPTKVVMQTISGHRITLDDKEELIDIKDKHGNHIQLNENGVSVVTEKAISLGALDGSAEPAVLGDKNAELHDAELDGIIQLTVMTAMGPSSVPINMATFQQIKTTKVTPTKSKKVTLD